MKKNYFFLSVINIFVCSFTLVGTIIGAGFASGKEVCTFIGIYKFPLVASAVFSILFCIGLLMIYKSANTPLPPKIEKAKKYIIFISEIISLTAMLSALNSMMSLIFESNLPYLILIFIMYEIISFGLSGLNKANFFLIPILITLICYMGTKSITNSNLEYNFSLENNFTLSSIFSIPLYLGLNLFCTYPIILSIQKTQKRKQKIWTAIITSAIIFIMLSVMCITVVNSSTNVKNSDLPLLTFISNHQPQIYSVAVITITLAITTSILSDGFVIKDTLSGYKKGNFITTLIFISCYLFAKIGFSNMVKSVYPLMGLLGIVILIIIFSKTTLKKTKPLGY